MDYRPAVLAIGLLTALYGCGGSRSHNNGPVTTYRARVNSVCRISNRKLGQLTNVRSIAVTEDTIIAQIKTITAPAPISAAVASWLHYAQNATADTFKFANAKREHAARARAAFLISSHTAYARAHTLGLNSCAVVGTI
jgi:hypothetical protein